MRPRPAPGCGRARTCGRAAALGKGTGAHRPSTALFGPLGACGCACPSPWAASRRRRDVLALLRQDPRSTMLLAGHATLGSPSALSPAALPGLEPHSLPRSCCRAAGHSESSCSVLRIVRNRHRRLASRRSTVLVCLSNGWNQSSLCTCAVLQCFRISRAAVLRRAGPRRPPVCRPAEPPEHTLRQSALVVAGKKFPEVLLLAFDDDATKYRMSRYHLSLDFVPYEVSAEHYDVSAPQGVCCCFRGVVNTRGSSIAMYPALGSSLKLRESRECLSGKF